ncbi:MAG: hypothetical protein IPN77_33575 [Sandaracinaceae bacterium]|nr:hypothetical protein [Sandaracinaceae bacterium]
MLVFTNGLSGREEVAGNACTGCTRIPFQATRTRARLVSFGSETSRHTPPPALSVTARNIGTGVVVCWGPTDTPPEHVGLELGRQAGLTIRASRRAMRHRHPPTSTTTAELAPPARTPSGANVT